MVAPEQALERMSVENAWHLLSSLSSQVIGKQTELQVRQYRYTTLFCIICYIVEVEVLVPCTIAMHWTLLWKLLGLPLSAVFYFEVKQNTAIVCW